MSLREAIALSGERVSFSLVDEAQATKQSPINRLESFEIMIRLNGDCFGQRAPSQ